MPKPNSGYDDKLVFFLTLLLYKKKYPIDDILIIRNNSIKPLNTMFISIFYYLKIQFIFQNIKYHNLIQFYVLILLFYNLYRVLYYKNKDLEHSSKQIHH